MLNSYECAIGTYCRTELFCDLIIFAIWLLIANLQILSRHINFQEYFTTPVQQLHSEPFICFFRNSYIVCLRQSLHREIFLHHFFVLLLYVFIINNQKICILYLGYSVHPCHERSAKNWSSIVNTVDLFSLEAIATVAADILVSSVCCNINAVTRKRKYDQLYSLKVDNGIVQYSILKPSTVNTSSSTLKVVELKYFDPHLQSIEGCMQVFDSGGKVSSTKETRRSKAFLLASFNIQKKSWQCLTKSSTIGNYGCLRVNSFANIVRLQIFYYVLKCKYCPRIKILFYSILSHQLEYVI